MDVHGRAHLIDLDSDPVDPAGRDGPTRWNRWALALAVIAALMFAADSGSPQTASVAAHHASVPTVWGSYAAPVAQSDLVLLVAVDTAGQVIGYACDGERSVWFSGRAAGTAITIASGTAQLDAVVERDRVRGILTLDGEHPISLRPVGPGGGLFAAPDRDGAVRAWIMLGGGADRGAGSPAARKHLTVPPPAIGTLAGGQTAPTRIDRLTPKWGRFARGA